MLVDIGKLETMMNHFLREGFSGTVDNKLRTVMSTTTKLDIDKVEGGWTVTVHHGYNNIEKVVVSYKDMMFWLYRRTFR
jgi:hypothetical protein